MVNCRKVDVLQKNEMHGSVVLLNGTTVYDSYAEATCDAGYAAFGKTLWRCDEYGMWTKPRSFKCIGNAY